MIYTYACTCYCYTCKILALRSTKKRSVLLPMVYRSVHPAHAADGLREEMRKTVTRTATTLARRCLTRACAYDTGAQT